jgi:cytoskeleton protein RodZ
VTESELQSAAATAPVPGSAGMQLRAAREAAGMSIDAVAQQLKLAPRQVKALEDGEFALLPGRTFVRGFMRNYARLVHLDPEAVLGALPSTAAQTLDSPALHATAPTMGELPTTDAPRHGWTRWAIPLTLVAIIGATAAWEWMHPPGSAPRTLFSPAEHAPPASPAPEGVGTPLPNPVAPPLPPEAAPPPAEPAAAEKAAAGPEAAPATAAPHAAEAPLTLAFRDFSWTEVKERSGRVLLSGMHARGTTQAVSGSPPLDVVIGNASDVTLTWRGQQVDLAPYTRQNVARLTLE